MAPSESEMFRAWAGTLADINGAMELLDWDRDTVMPPSAADTRGHQVGTLAALYHRELVRPEYGPVLAELTGDPDIDPRIRREAQLLAHRRERAERVPESLVREVSEASSEALAVWTDARERGDWNALCEPLARLVGLKRREADAISDGHEPYDALLDQYEPGARGAELAPVFAELTARLGPLVAAGVARSAQPLPEGHWPRPAQLQLAHDIAELIGFNLNEGRIGESAHPFSSSSGLGDVRFATRFDEGNPINNVLSVLHEAGHAMYEQGFSAELARSALWDAPSLGSHEAQARFWENHVGGTLEFWEVIEPRMRELFPEPMRGLAARDFHAATATVRPSLIRVEADEVTYNLHIVLRFELERALISGDLEVADLPEAWNTWTRALLGIVPDSPADGVMQDVHWPGGLFGYFPTYTLGNLYAAQLAAAADAELVGLEAAIAHGAFGQILGFMRDRIHRHGALYPTAELMTRATGVPLGADMLIAHLERRTATPGAIAAAR
jgi:carboxypeptidase Taq